MLSSASLLSASYPALNYMSSLGEVLHIVCHASLSKVVGLSLSHPTFTPTIRTEVAARIKDRSTHHPILRT